MSLLKNELNRLCSELSSDNVTSRNKTVERLDTILDTSKNEIIELLRSHRENAETSISWKTLFNSSIRAILKHAAKIEDTMDPKKSQTMRNKNYVYQSVVRKLIEYNLEEDGNFLCKSTLLCAFIDGVSVNNVVENFGSLFLHILDRGIYKSPKHVCDLKVNEYSRILSHLFELNTHNNQILHFEVLAVIVRTIELAVEQVHIGEDLISYVAEVKSYAQRAIHDKQKKDVIKLFNIFVTELVMDYRYTICTEIQEVLPVLYKFYSLDMKADAKKIFFQSIYTSICAIYPDIKKGEVKNNGIQIKDDWHKTLQKLKSIVDVEIREYKPKHLRSHINNNDKILENFTKMAALIMYIVHWHPSALIETEGALTDTCRKQAKTCDKLEVILKFVQGDATLFSEIWLAILAEILQKQKTVLNAYNVKLLLQTLLSILHNYEKALNLHHLRICITSILVQENELIAYANVNKDYCHEIWLELVNCLIADTITTPDVILQKQILFQALIAHGKLQQNHCQHLLNMYITSAAMKSTECISTIRQILIYAELCNLEKTSEIVGRVITWLHEYNDKIDAHNMLLNITTADTNLVADTCAIAVINFLDETLQRQESKKLYFPDNEKLQLLLYKYNKKLICLEDHAKCLPMPGPHCSNIVNDKSSCILQENYELLMRTLDFQTTKEFTCKHILTDLMPLQKMVAQLEKFIIYGVFNRETITQCPLIKRIGFFLSHLEFQLKSNQPRNFESSDLLEALQIIEATMSIFTRNALLLEYIESQPLEELIEFLGKSLSFNASKQMRNDLNDSPNMIAETLKILAKLCGSSSHWKDAFKNIYNYKLNIKTELYVFLSIVQITCVQSIQHESIAKWFVEKLKIIFQLYYTNIKIITKILDILPSIFLYVQEYHDPREDMLIALNSLLKVAFKKSYPIHLSTKLIDGIRLISHSCCILFGQQNFKTICLSCVKFLSYPALEVQLATVKAITSFMDANWLNKSNIDGETHFGFCQELFQHIDWKNIPTTTKDILQNSNTVTFQVLVSIFVFSSYHQKAALQELTYFCALRKLNEIDLNVFKETASYFNCDLSELTKPYVADVIHYWTAKQYPILKFPYFFCSTSFNDFIRFNLRTIVHCLLMYGKKDDIKTLKSYGSEKDLLNLAFPLSYAFTLPYHSDCAEAQSRIFKDHIGKMCDNYTHHKYDIMNSKLNVQQQADCIYYVIEFFQDNNAFPGVLDFSIYYETTKWYNLNLNSLKKCLAYCLLDNIKEDHINAPFAKLIAEKPYVLVYFLDELKINCCNYVFAADQLKSFYTFFVVSNIIINSFDAFKNNTTDSVQNCIKYFLRDVISFILYFLKNANCCELRKLALVSLQHILNHQLVKTEICYGVIKTQLNDLCRTCAKIAIASSNYQQLALDILEYLIVDNEENLKDVIELINEFPATEHFDKFRQLQNTSRLLSKNTGSQENDLQAIMQSFINAKNHNIDSLERTQQYIINNKNQLQNHPDLLLALIKCLIDIIRNSSTVELCLEAEKCLGEIGAIKILGILYYMPNYNTNYENPLKSTDSKQVVLNKFVQNILGVLEELLLTFNPKIHHAVCKLIQHLINTKHGKSQLKDFPYLNVFLYDTSENLSIPSSLNWLSVLKASENLPYEKWICEFTSALYEQSNMKAFQALAALDKHFADSSLLPFVKLLMLDKEQHMSSLTEILAYYFAKVNEFLNADDRRCQRTSIFRDKRVVSKFLEICECIRIHNEWKLPLNLLHVSNACNYCQAYFTSIMYLELWALEEKTSPEQRTSKDILDNECFQLTAKKAYESIGCRSAISGFLNPLISRLDFLNLNNNWSDIMLEMGANNTVCNEIYTSVLKRNGMLMMATQNHNNKSIDYEVCWRLGQWNTPVEGHSKLNTLNDMEYEFEKHHFNAMKCIFNREENNSLAAITNARQCVLSILKEISIECLQSVYKYLSWLQLLQQTQDFCKVQFATISNVEYVFEKWENEANLDYDSFYWKEQLLTHQMMLFKTAGVRASRKINNYYKEDPVVTSLLKCVKECKKSGEINLAKQNVAALRAMNVSNVNIEASVLLEDADLCLKTDNAQIAQAALERLLLTDRYINCLQRVPALRKYGEYLMESNMEAFDFVLPNVFIKSAELLDEFSNAISKNSSLFNGTFEFDSFEKFKHENCKRTYEIIAKYADREYTQLNTYVKSAEFQMKCTIIRENKKAAQSIGRQIKDKDRNFGAIYIKKFADLDEKEIRVVEAKRTEYLCIAMENYIKFCQIDENMSSSTIYRIIALWFANKQDAKLHEKIKKYIDTVPSYKFIPALNQITARLNSQNEEFIDIIKNLLIRCMQDHPHHTLYQLMPLVHAFDDCTANSTLTSKNRVQIATEIITKTKNNANSKCVEQMNSLFPALIEFANFSVEGGKNTSLSLSDKLIRLKNLDSVHCPTVDLPVSANKQYNITGVMKWDEKVIMVGGINAPKKIICLCSDGIKRSQLLKGKDDLRQDAVMQQVFTMINGLLSTEPESRKFQLQLRTYKVVPLSMRSGILEWCENTIPLGVYLGGDGKGGAHNKYRPKDFTINKCRKLSMDNLKSDIEQRYKVFSHICANIKPVLHYFLLEHFVVPGVWFERRLAYTNSVATNSIVGFILGLGDRHTQNILIDQKTAELIHIDFGIAFEQGKIMPTPETVPFRLTRDIVSAMGVCGTNGLFKKSCEATMIILRRHQSVITTILEVLLYDPLYVWTIVSKNSADPDNTEEKNLSAQRALLCVQNKLEGKQAGILGTSGAHVQVQRLINEALSNRNLCLLYPGWDPYL